jgi:hypothetical protein
MDLILAMNNDLSDSVAFLGVRSGLYAPLPLEFKPHGNVVWI